MTKLRHVAVGGNYLQGTINFNNMKQASVTFAKPFTITPSVMISLKEQSSSVVPYKVLETKTGFTVKFQNNYTGLVDWEAKERFSS